MISNKKTLFMKSKETEPYIVYFLNESIFQSLLQEVQTTSIEKKVCLIGYITENNLNDSEAQLKFDNSILKIDISRILQGYKISNNPYILYGSLRKKSDSPVLFVNFYRVVSSDFNFDSYRLAINCQRSIINECQTLIRENSERMDNFN